MFPSICLASTFPIAAQALPPSSTSFVAPSTATPASQTPSSPAKPVQPADVTMTEFGNNMNAANLLPEAKPAEYLKAYDYRQQLYKAGFRFNKPTKKWEATVYANIFFVAMYHPSDLKMFLILCSCPQRS
jgi:hypothetical protein